MDVRSPGEEREDVHSCYAFRIAGEAVSDDKGLPARAARRLKPRPRLVVRKSGPRSVGRENEERDRWRSRDSDPQPNQNDRVLCSAVKKLACDMNIKE
eukprot:2729884-Rhodomonas_salina.1